MTTTPNPQARALELLGTFEASVYWFTDDSWQDDRVYSDNEVSYWKAHGKVPELLAELRAALDRETAALAEVPKWLPIEGAPKNSTDILLYGVPYWKECPRAYVGHWASDLSGEDQPPFEGWFRQVGAGFQQVPQPPTHWMPLPAPPKHYPQAEILSQSNQQVGEVAVSFTVGRIVGDAQGFQGRQTGRNRADIPTNEGVPLREAEVRERYEQECGGTIYDESGCGSGASIKPTS